MAEQTRNRKAEHIRISLDKDVQARIARTGFEDVDFVHRALPEIDRQEIDLSVDIFNHKFAAPLIVGAITGGTHESMEINANIAEAVEDLGLGMGVGSQRAAIENKKLERTFAIARKKAPTAFLIANIGAVQLANGYTSKELKKAVEMIDADAIAVHLNPLQETAQPEGQTNFRGIIDRIRELAKELDTPVIAKETGAGIAAEEAKKLEAAGVKCIDVSGVGGTSWAGVEYYRAKERHNSFQRTLAELFWDWGIPTAVSIVEVSQTVEIPIIASGGIRNGLDAGKALALGASLTSFSQPALRAAVRGLRETRNSLSLLIAELRNCMFLVGADSVQKLRKAPVVISGKTSKWLKTRGFKVNDYAKRGSD
jgi:isopentenyl-diphosphate delta-isomerase